MVSTKCQCCNEETAKFKCSQCLSAEYCSAQCQADDWVSGNHKYECIAGKNDRTDAAPDSDRPLQRQKSLAPPNLIVVAKEEFIRLKSSDGSYYRVRKHDAVAMSPILRNIIRDQNDPKFIQLNEIPADILRLIAKMINDYPEFVNGGLPMVTQDAELYVRLLNTMKYLDISGERGFQDSAFWNVSEEWQMTAQLKTMIDELRLLHMLRRSHRLETAEQSNHAFIVLESSVSDNAGNGLYALRNFEPGEILPMVYPGVALSSAKNVDRLNEYLARITNEVFEHERVGMPGDLHRRLTESSRKKLNGILQTLRSKWNLVVHNVNEESAVDWDTLYDTFIAYWFENVYWNHYNANGTLHADINVLENAPLFMNEGSEYKQFENRFSERIQSSRPNVESYTEKGKIKFRALRPIARYDELILNYGKLYNRDAYPAPNSRPGTFRSKSITEDNAVREMYLHADGTIKRDIQWLASTPAAPPTANNRLEDTWLKFLKRHDYTKEALRLLKLQSDEILGIDIPEEQAVRVLNWLNNIVEERISKKQYDNAARLVTTSHFRRLIIELLPEQ